MKKIFRWQGIVAFAVLLAVFVVLWISLVDIFAEQGIEKGGTAIVGAKVELDKADVTLSPLGLTLTGLQITNPEEPMTNAVEAGRIAFTMDGLNALRRKVIVEEMSLERVRLNTPRKTSGAIEKKEPGEEKEGKEIPILSMEIPDVDEILEKEKNDLLTLRQIEHIRTDSEAMKTKWEKKIEELSNMADAEQYTKRIEGLKSEGKGSVSRILGSSKELVNLQKEIKKDLETITSTKPEFENDLASLKQRVDSFPQTVQKDVERLQEKYSFTPEGLKHMSGLLFGDEVARKIETALTWYKRLSPIVQRLKEQKKGKDVVTPLRAKGMDVRFKEYNPLPDFLVRTAHVSLDLPEGTFTGQINNVTPDQDILGSPLTFLFSGEKLKTLGAVNIEGTLNRINPDERKDTVQCSVREYKAKGLALSESDSLPITLEDALVNLDLSVTLEKENISAVINTALSSVHLSAPAEENDNAMIVALSGALSDVSDFALTIELTGTLDDYDMRISSDLDSVLQSAVTSLVKDQIANFENELTSRINEIVASPLKELNQDIGGLELFDDEFTTLNKKLTDLLPGGSKGLKDRLSDFL